MNWEILAPIVVKCHITKTDMFSSLKHEHMLAFWTGQPV